MSRKLTGNISLKYNIPLPIAKEVAGHIIHIIITDWRAGLDIESITDTVFVYNTKWNK
jgi:hypothetical protein